MEQVLNGYIAFHKGKRAEVRAATIREAQEQAAKVLGAKKVWQVAIGLAEVGSKPYVQVAVD